MVFYTFFQSSAGSPLFHGVREPIYAGSWYPDTPEKLAQTIDEYLQNADVESLGDSVQGIVAPHAGFVYSGSVAAHSYKAVQGKEFDLIILMGNAHREMFQGAVIDGVTAYTNSLGNVKVDIEIGAFLDKKCAGVTINSKPHQKEHSLELQLPFLQRSLKPGFKILPILFGVQSEQAMDEIIRYLPELLKGKRCLLVASTDLTHYPSYSDAKQIDIQTIEYIAAMDCDGLQKFESSELSRNTTNLACVLCAGTATRTVIALSKAQGANAGKILKYANSGDVATADRSQVVGYGAVAFFRDPKIAEARDNQDVSLTDEDKTFLLNYSRNLLERFITTNTMVSFDKSHPLANINRGVFVTLHKGRELRGCIGYIEPFTSCLEAVRDNTISAAVKDPRFPKVTQSELNEIILEISVLTPPKPIKSWRDIQIGQHGIILEKGPHRSVFLPQVPVEQDWDLETTLMYLALKAGLPADGWMDASFQVFQAQAFSEMNPELRKRD